MQPDRFSNKVGAKTPPNACVDAIYTMARYRVANSGPRVSRVPSPSLCWAAVLQKSTGSG